MNFQFYSHTFQVEEIYSDPWVDCDDVGCGGSDGPSGDWISVSATPTVVPYGGQQVVFQASSNGSITGWSWQRSSGGSAWDPGCATATCQDVITSSGVMTVYGPAYTSAEVSIEVDPCDPTTQPSCLLPLRPEDEIRIGSSLDSSSLRQNVPDSVKTVCASLFNAFKSDWINNRGSIQRGNPNLPDSTVGTHDAAYGEGIYHIDQDWLDQVQVGNSAHSKVLLALLLHEAAHKLNFPKHGPPNSSNGYDVWPYNVTKSSSSGSPPSCVLQ